MTITSALASAASSPMKVLRSSSERLAILENPEAPAMIWMP